MEEIKNNVKHIRVVVEDAYNKDGVKQNFNIYKIVVDGGKLVRCKFKRDVNLNLFDGMKKFECDVEYYSDASKFYEYPVVWVGSVKTDTIKKIR